MRPGVAALLAAASLLAGPAWGRGEVDDPVQVAAGRFDLRPDLIAAVIAVESAGDPKAVSSAGAMGLMQLMPATWAQLRAQLSLGPDPFDPRDNVLAGSAYLRQLLDRYGAAGYLAAYNAGPGRYEQSLAGRPLPQETARYVAKLGGRLEGQLDRPAKARPMTRLEGLFAPSWSSALGGQAPVRAAPEGDARGLFAARVESRR